MAWKVLLTLTAFVSLSHQQAFGDSITTAWTSGVSGNWSGANWDKGVPNNGGGNTFTAILSDSGSPITHTLDISPTLDALQMFGPSADTLALNGNTLTVNNAVTVVSGSYALTGSGTLYAGSVSNGATLALSSNANLSVSGGFDNSGSMLADNSTLTLGSLLAEGDLNNSAASFRVQDSGTLTVNGVVNNTSAATLVLNNSAGTVTGAPGATGETTGISNTASTVRVDNGSLLIVGSSNGPNVDVSNTSGSSLTVQGYSALAVFGGMTNDHSTFTARGSDFVSNLSQANFYGGNVTNSNSAVFNVYNGAQVGVYIGAPGTGNFTNSTGSIVNVYNGGYLGAEGVSTNTTGGQLNISTSGQVALNSLDNQANSTITLDSGGALFVSGALKNEGMVTLTADSANTYMSAGAIINSGIFSVNGTDASQPYGVGFNEVDTGAFINKSSGVLTIGGGVNGGQGAYMMANFFKNSGQVTISGPQGIGSSNGQLYVAGNFINAAGGTLELSASQEEFADGGIVGVSGSFKNYGTITVDGAIASHFNGGLVSSETQFTNGRSGILTLNAGTNGGSGGTFLAGSFLNYGTVTVSGASDNYSSSGGNFFAVQFTNGNSGTVTVGGGSNGSAGGEMAVAGPFNNYGTVIVGGSDGSSVAGDLDVEGYYDEYGHHVGLYNQYAGSTLVNGTLEASQVDIAGGLLAGGGTITADVIIETDGTLAPGGLTDPADMSIVGNLVMDGTMGEDINGPSDNPADFDAIAVTGDIAFDGVLDVDLLSGYVPTLGEEFVILTWTGLYGDENLTILDPYITGGGLRWTLEWVNGDNEGGIVTPGGELLLETVATPEPASLLLLGTGIASLLAARRKRPVK